MSSARIKRVFHTEYTFYIRPEHEQKLWGSMSYDQLKEYDDFIKSIPYGQEKELRLRESFIRIASQTKTTLFTIKSKGKHTAKTCSMFT